MKKIDDKITIAGLRRVVSLVEQQPAYARALRGSPVVVVAGRFYQDLVPKFAVEVSAALLSIGLKPTGCAKHLIFSMADQVQSGSFQVEIAEGPIRLLDWEVVRKSKHRVEVNGSVQFRGRGKLSRESAVRLLQCEQAKVQTEIAGFQARLDALLADTANCRSEVKSAKHRHQALVRELVRVKKAGT